ncbi:MAG: hypothetical protein J6N52_00535 [Clostridia bacterium]|nr:hypothetical protein [Clostridia bacterium]
MSDEKCGGKCKGCGGCSEKVILSADKSVSIVSSLTFTERQLAGCRMLVLVTECARSGEGGCFAGIKFYKNGQETAVSEPKKYEIPAGDMKQQNFSFVPDKNADKAEITIFCSGSAVLDIEHINVLRL